MGRTSKFSELKAPTDSQCNPIYEMNVGRCYIHLRCFINILILVILTPYWGYLENVPLHRMRMLKDSERFEDTARLS